MKVVSHGRVLGRRGFGISVAAGLAGLGLVVSAQGAPARAQGFPSIEPTRDAAVSYEFASTATGPMQIQAYASPELQMLRVQLATGSDYLLLDRTQERVMLVSPDKGLIFAVSSNGMLHRRLGPDSGLRFSRAGHRVVAGEGCTVWIVRGPSGGGDACVTRDGIVLEGDGQGDRPDDRGQIPSGHFVATSVSYGPLPPAFFTPPPGLQEVDLPPSLFRAMIPGLAGIPSR
jgi:hypothetical protein